MRRVIDFFSALQLVDSRGVRYKPHVLYGVGSAEGLAENSSTTMSCWRVTTESFHIHED
jgi:hypothetical protein